MGMSDLAMAMTCQSAVLANKLRNGGSFLELKTLLTLECGHWLERGAEESLKAAGTILIPQLEISVVHQSAPIKAHLDLTLVNASASAITVLELKSLARMKDCVWPAHESQQVGQISLLHEFWSESAFRLETGGSSRKLSELFSEHLDVRMSVRPKTRGYVLAVSPNDARAFGPYYPDPNKNCPICCR